MALDRQMDARLRVSPEEKKVNEFRLYEVNE